MELHHADAGDAIRLGQGPWPARRKGAERPVGKDHVRFDMVPVGKLVSEVAKILVECTF